MLLERKMSVLSLMCGGLRRYHPSLLVACRHVVAELLHLVLAWGNALQVIVRVDLRGS